MKIILSFLAGIILMAGFTTCGSSENIETAEDTTSQETNPFIDTTLVDPMDTVNTGYGPQEVLDNFLLQFKEVESLPSIRYGNAYEYESTLQRYHYEKDKLKGVFIDMGIEGGGGGHLRVQYNELPDGATSETVLYLPYSSEYEKGYFSFVEEGRTNCFEVSGGDFDHPIILGTSEEQAFEYDKDLSHHRSLIQGNISEFIQHRGSYSWDIRREKVDSEYGEIEIHETIEVDSIIFKTQFSVN